MIISVVLILIFLILDGLLITFLFKCLKEWYADLFFLGLCVFLLINGFAAQAFYDWIFA